MSNFDLSPYSILFVDDEGFTRQIVVQLLRSLGCENVRQASNVSQALHVLKEMDKVDIIISDFRMPEDNGLKLVKEVRTGNASVSRGTPIAMLTGFSEKSLVEVALALDVNAFLVKPVSRNGLGDRLQRLLEITADQSWLSTPAVYDRIDIDVVITPPQYPRSSEGGVDAAPDKTKRVLARLPLLQKRYDDTDLSDAVIAAVGRLIDNLGEVDVSNMLAIFEALERHEILTMQEIASMLAVPEKITKAPEVFLAEDIHTVDNEILFRSGTLVTKPIASIVGDLNEVGAISLSPDKIRELGLNANDLPPPSTGAGRAPVAGYDPSVGLAMQAVPAADLKAGDVLARTVFTSDGRLYGKSGATVTSRMVDVLKDLSGLEKIASTLWIENKS
jgi:CheY-like chemotaxis protein